MKGKLILLILFLSGMARADQPDSVGKYDVSLWTGYHYSLGYLGLKFEFSPSFWSHRSHTGVGIGISTVQPRFSIGERIDFYRSSSIRASIGSDLSAGLKTNMLLRNGGSVIIGAHYYANPYTEISFIFPKRPFYFKISTGYSFLLNPVNISSGSSNPDQSILKVIRSGYFIGFGVAANFDRFDFKPGL